MPVPQVNEVVLCGKISIARGGETGAESAEGSGRRAGPAPSPGPVSGSGASGRTALALERWAESLRGLNANVVAKVSYR